MKCFTAIVLSLLAASISWADPVDLSAPSNSLGSANSRGYLEIWRELDEADFGRDLKLPFRVGFSSERQTDSPYLGKGWWCPMLESTAFLKREKMLKATLMCGKALYLRKDGAQINTFYTLDKDWKGVIEGKIITISREDGWRLIYENGRIKELRTDSGRILNWIYSGTLATEIQEVGSPSSVFRVDFDSGGKPKGVYVNNKLHSFVLDRRPKVQSLAGTKVVAGFDTALSLWNWPNGKKEAFQFEVTEEIQPNLKLTDRQNEQTTYVWDAASGHIVSDGSWTYQIGQTNSEFESPDLRRVNAAGVQEFVKSDNRMGIIERESVGKGHIISEAYKTPGPLYGKLQRVVRVVDGKETPIAQYSYDEKGRLLRKTDEMGFTKAFTYDEKGKLIKSQILPPKDPVAIKTLREKEATLLKAVEAAVKENEKGDKMQELGFFYIHQMRDYEKALKLVPLMQNPKQQYNIQFSAIHDNFNLTRAEKNAKYKELLKKYPNRKDQLTALIASNGS